MRSHSEQRINQRRRGFFSPCHLVTLSPCLLLLLGLPFGQEKSPERLLQEGHAAFARGDYVGAAQLYEQAEMHSTDPAEVAFYLAGAKYHLAVKMEGPSAELQEAEHLYRCCLDPRDPRRPHALCGLGNCLLHKAGNRDAAGLRAALACYDQCLQSAGTNEALATAARYNREKARLLLLQWQPPANGSASDRPPNEDMNSRWPPPDMPRPQPLTANEPGSEDRGDPRSANSGNPEDGKSTAKSDQPPQPGKGNLEPIPDQVDAPPLSPHDAAEHLTLAAKKVLHERQTHHRRSERPASTGVKDW